jgi:hypothetical protein
MTRRGALALLSGDRGLAMLILSFVDHDPKETRAVPRRDDYQSIEA